MHKVSQGEEDLTSEPRTTNAYGNSNWAEEFAGSEGITKQPESSADQDWAAEFTTNQQPDLAEKWTKEFNGSALVKVLNLFYLYIFSFYKDGASAEVFRSENPSQDDFWSQLQQDWEKAADENPASYGWLKETQQDPLSEVIIALSLISS